MYRTRGVRPAIGRYRENAATGNRAQMLKKVGLEGAEKRYIWQLSVVNVSGWALPARWRRIPSCITRRTVWCAGRLHPRPDANPLLKLWQETGKQVLLITHDIEKRCLWRLNWFCFHPALDVCGAAAAQLCSPLCCGRVEPQHKSDPQFIAMREYVLSRVFEHGRRSHECAH